MPNSTLAPRRRSGLSKESFTAKYLKNDITAGLVNGVVSVPDGLAAGALAGVSPVAGLYASITGPIAGGVVQTSHMMSIATTSAAAIAAGQVIGTYPEAQKGPALFLLTLLTGAMLIIMALLKAGRLVRYVPYAVMQGFLFGVSLVLVLDQVSPMVGYSPQGPNKVVQFIDVMAHIGSWDVLTAVIGFSALAIVVAINFTKLATWASLIALVVPSAAVALLGWNSMQQVVDVSPIPRGLPALTLPDFSLISLDMLLGAFSLAAVIAIQGAGVSQSVENLDDSEISTSSDMGAQGVGNVVSGLFGGLPVGASVGQTALNISAGARTRWASIFSGIWMLIFVIALAPIIEQVPMAVLGALMVFAGATSMKVKTAASILRTGIGPAIGFLTTLIVSLVASVPMAVIAGIGITIVLNMIAASDDVAVHQLTKNDEGQLLESEAPAALASNEVTVLSVYGDLFFAGANTLQQKLPAVGNAENPVVVLRLRRQRGIGATLINVLNEYADDLEANGGKLYLSGVHADIAEQLKRSAKLDLGDSVEIHEARPVIGASTSAAVQEGREWLSNRRTDHSAAALPDEERRSPMPSVIVAPEGALQPPRASRE